MKKNLLLITIILFLTACQENELDSFDNITTSNKTKAIANESLAFDWETIQKIDLIGYSNATVLPWYNGSSTQLPFYILQNYKKADGWVMCYNYCNDKSEAKYGKYYLMFYNIFTGIMRVYYYNIYDIASGSTTFWSLELDKPSSLLNAASGYFSKPSSHIQNNPSVYTTNITKHETKSVSRGWNCFDLEFAYDPTFTQTKSNMHMSIGAYNVTASNLTLTGDVSLSSEGTIASTQGVSSDFQNILNTSVDAAGKSASDLIKAKAKGKDNKSFFPKLTADALSSLASGGVKEALKFGANLVFGSFLGKESQITTQDIKIKTSGTLKLTGSITSNSIPNIEFLSSLLVPGSQSSMSDFLYPSYDKSFGSWTLTKDPVVYFSDETIYYRSVSYPGDNSRPFSIIRLFDLNYNSDTDVKINPDILDKIERYEVSSTMVYYKKFQGEDGLKKVSNNLAGGNYIVGHDVIPFYNDNTKGNETIMYLNPSFAHSQGYNTMYPRGVRWSSRSSTEVYCESGCGIPNSACAVKVTVKLYPKAPYNTDPIVSTRTYLPKYERTFGKLDYFKNY